MSQQQQQQTNVVSQQQQPNMVTQQQQQPNMVTQQQQPYFPNESSNSHVFNPVNAAQPSQHGYISGEHYDPNVPTMSVLNQAYQRK